MLGKSSAGAFMHLKPYDKNYRYLEVSIANLSFRNIWEAMHHVWPQAHWPGEQSIHGIESQL